MILGVLLGVSGAVCTMVIAATQQAQVDLQFDLQRADHVVLNSDDGAIRRFDPVQLSQISNLEPVGSVGEFSTWSDGEQVSGSSGFDVASGVPVLVADKAGLAATGTRVTAGAGVDLMEAGPGNVAWVGEGLAHELGVGPAGTANVVDAQVVVDGSPFSVAGTLTNSGGFSYVSRSIVVSRELARRYLGQTGVNVRVVASVRPGSAAVVARYAELALNPTGQTPVRDVTPPDGDILVGRVGNDLRRFGTALVVLIGVIGVVTVANTLTMSVYQRRRELGLRSALGWSRLQIGSLVLIESAVAGVMAGIIGAAVGLAASASWCLVRGWEMVVPSGLPFVLIGAAVLACLLGGLIPALRAASTSPVVAMRS